jgi:hypothetical protein
MVRFARACGVFLVRSPPPRVARACAVALLPLACGGSSEASVPRRDGEVTSASEWIGASDGPARTASEEAPWRGVAGTWILHVGDSFAGGPFAASLSSHLAAVGARQAPLAKDSTSTYSWAEDRDLDAWLARRPAMVLVTLGANEVDLPAPSARAGEIHAIARKASAVAPCVWVAPPLWKSDRGGWLQTIHDHCDPCLFFDSDAVLGGLRAGERRSDGIHPNDQGAARWADALWGWLEEHRDPARAGWQLLPYATRR